MDEQRGGDGGGAEGEPQKREEAQEGLTVEAGGEKEEQQLKSEDEAQDHDDAGGENVLLPLLKAMFPHVDDKVPPSRSLPFCP
jgi:hypothetical protein